MNDCNQTDITDGCIVQINIGGNGIGEIVSIDGELKLKAHGHSVGFYPIHKGMEVIGHAITNPEILKNEAERVKKQTEAFALAAIKQDA
jgi:hypothetical protein